MKKLFIVVNVDSFFLSHRRELAAEALANGYDVTIVALDSGRRKEIEAMGLKFIPLPIDSVGRNPVMELITMLFLTGLYMSHRPDIVHHVGLKTILWGSLATKITGIKRVVNAVSGLGVTFSSGNRSLIPKIILSILRFTHQRRYVRVIFQNRQDREMFISAGIVEWGQTVLIQGSGVDLKQFYYSEEPNGGIINITLAARMIRSKGVAEFVEAAHILKEEYVGKVCFLLCGAPDYNPEAVSQEWLESICDGKYIEWRGYCDNIAELLALSHIACLPSYYREGVPKSLIEAAACGRPIVTTDSVGCRDTVVEGWNGLLVPHRNGRALADALRVLIDNGELRRTMGRNSRLLAEKLFSLDDVIAKHLEIYDSLVSK